MYVLIYDLNLELKFLLPLNLLLVLRRPQLPILILNPFLVTLNRR